MKINSLALSYKQNNTSCDIKSRKVIGDYSNTKYVQVPRAGLVNFGFKKTAVVDLLKGANAVYSTANERDLLNWERETQKVGKSRLKRIMRSLDRLGTVFIKKINSRIIKKSLKELKKTKEPLSDFEKALVRVWSKLLRETKSLPNNDKLLSKYGRLQACSGNAWAKAKAKSDFQLFAPHLEKMFIAAKRIAQCTDSKRLPLDVMLEDTGYTTEQIDNLMSALKDNLIPLLKQISTKQKPDCAVLNRHVEMPQFQQFLNIVTHDLGLDDSRVRFGKVEHSVMYDFNSPYEVGVGISIPTKEGEKSTMADCLDILTSLTHEGGHGLVELGASPLLNKTGLAGAVDYIHESQARLWENNVGRSREFWQRYFPILKEKVAGFEDVDFEGFYKAFTAIQPSVNRTMADEVTYNFHIMIRYELEKEILNPKNSDEDIKRLVSELPAKWNKKYEEYLGVTPKNDAEGVLQDGHWADGLIGYFPVYALANIASAQFMKTAKNEIPDLSQRIASGDLKTLGNWLREKIYQHGQIYTPDEILQRVTGESLNPQYFIEYLKSRYS